MGWSIKLLWLIIFQQCVKNAIKRQVNMDWRMIILEPLCFWSVTLWWSLIWAYRRQYMHLFGVVWASHHLLAILFHHYIKTNAFEPHWNQQHYETRWGIEQYNALITNCQHAWPHHKVSMSNWLNLAYPIQFTSILASWECWHVLYSFFHCWRNALDKRSISYSVYKLTWSSCACNLWHNYRSPSCPKYLDCWTIWCNL